MAKWYDATQMRVLNQPEGSTENKKFMKINCTFDLDEIQYCGEFVQSDGTKGSHTVIVFKPGGDKNVIIIEDNYQTFKSIIK